MTALLISVFLIISSCSNTQRTVDLIESEVELKFKGNPFKYSAFNTENDEYVALLGDKKIYIHNLNNSKDIDSVSLDFIYPATETNNFGEISSFSFLGIDSLFVLTDNAVFFVHKKKLAKTLLINSLGDKHQYKSIRFANLDKTPIYFDPKNNEVVGRIYCHTCGQTNASFYKQPQLAGIDLETGKLKVYDVPFSKIYVDNYFGFSNEVTISSFGSNSIVSFSVDPNVYLFDRKKHKLQTFQAKSHETDPIPLEIAKSTSIEDKIKALTINPMYTEVRYDKYNKLYYRFLHKETPLKNPDGTYNTFEDKKLILTIYDNKFVKLKEFTLDKNYREFISFVTLKGLYIFYRVENQPAYNFGYFKVLNIKDEV